LDRTRESLIVSYNKFGEGVRFMGTGVGLFGQDIQLMVNMLSRAVLQGYAKAVAPLIATLPSPLDIC
jgi:hypothetical protein